VALAIEGLDPGIRYELRHRRVDREFSNITRAWERLGCPTWPDERGWAELQSADRLELIEPTAPASVRDGRLVVEFELPMPAISLIELLPLS
jgi:xylan 1,4-beta-xylosidase